MADSYEKLIASYLRLNAYFSINNFIVHAADDPQRFMAQHIGNYTETDILGVRMPYSSEKTGSLLIANHAPLVEGSAGKTDVVIGEVKSGNNNTPNSVWKASTRSPALDYIVRFVGLQDSETDIGRVATALATTFRYVDSKCRFRYVVFAHKPNTHYMKLGVTYITFREVIRFLVSVRGQCWIDHNLGVASVHSQWDQVLFDVFAIANEHDLSEGERIARIENYLAIDGDAH